ncbi:MAG: tRNA lysidine(34) synthetase TilS [Acidobacteria bacterium]|nr:tRNA lysidine(34) synthetase TilS [Acidobacteriota bacterium]
MTRFPTRVWATIRRYGLLSEGDRVLVAVSGGVDSVVLLHVLAALAPRAGVRLAGVVHVHHGLRGAAADADAALCERLATDLGLPFDLVPVDVAGESTRRKWSLERTGHALRHAALRLVARRRLATRIALGHTLDDQAETVVLRLLRGAGTRGLAGMWPSHGPVIRPLIGCRRVEVEQYAATRGLIWNEDASNADPAIPRNRVRHDVLPALIAVAGSSLPARLARQADAWRDDEQWLAACVAVELPSVLTPHADGGWLLDLRRLDASPPMLRRRVRMASLEQMLPRGAVTLSRVDALERLETLRDGGRGRLGQLTVTRVGARLRFETDGDGQVQPSTPLRPRRAAAVPGECALSVPGMAVVGDGGMRVEAMVVPRAEWDADRRSGRAAGATWAALDADRVGPAMVVRSRRAGDRMRPLGAPGSQKIQDLMVNRKVARLDRDSVPVITTARGQIAWVVGLAVSEALAIQPQTTGVLLLQVTRSGGKA